jgi:ABC-type transport system involved in multi-copper enzyme maturation permease subunit
VNGAPAPVREALHARVAGLLEHAFNPIMLKELRASLRGKVFFICHMVILGCFTGGLFWIFGVQMPFRPGGLDDPGDPSVIGRIVFAITQVVQLGIVYLVVPAFAATSVSSERESLTHDLLLSTTMTARQIVWGKFTAAMTQAFTIFISMVPLVSLCFLFGGVTVYQIVANYAFLFAVSALMIAFALSMSASAATTQRAVASVYILTLIGGLLLWALGALLIRTAWVQSLMESMALVYGFMSSADSVRMRSPMDLADRVLYVHLVPGWLWIAATSLFFINATNRLKPIFANRSTPLRIYFAAVLFSAGAIAALLFYHSLPPDSPEDDRSYAMMAFAIIALAASLLGALFACEEPFPSPLSGPPAARKGWRRVLGLFLPGSNSGAAFAVITLGVFLLASFAVFLPFVRGFGRGVWTGLSPAYPLGAALFMVYCWSFFTAGFARFLAALLPERPMLLRIILVLTCLFLALFPLIHWVIAEAIDRDPTDELRRHGPLTLALSPVTAILSSLDLRGGRRDFPLYAGSGRIPVALAFPILSLAAGAIFLKLGDRARAKLKKELDAGLSERPPA